MHLTIIDPPRLDKTPSKEDALTAVRHSFSVVRARGQTIVHRNQLNSAIETWLIGRGFSLPATGAEGGEGVSTSIDELLGTARSSTFSFVRAGFVLKGGPWYCPHPARAIALDDDAHGRTIVVLSPLPAESLVAALHDNGRPKLEEAGLAYVARLGDVTCPWPLVDPLQLIGLQPVDATADASAAATHFLASELVPQNGGEHPASARPRTDLGRLSPSELNRFVRVLSPGGRREPLSSLIRNLPPRLWRSVRLPQDTHAFFAYSTYNEIDSQNQTERKVVVLASEAEKGAGHPARLVQVELDAFLAGRIEWAFLAALGHQVLVDVGEDGQQWSVLTFPDTAPTGPLRTWLALVGRPIHPTVRGEVWRIRTEAKEKANSILAQYFAAMREAGT